eukprot:262632-Amorphochlora_amoeboformis.AAC.1
MSWLSVKLYSIEHQLGWQTKLEEIFEKCAPAGMICLNHKFITHDAYTSCTPRAPESAASSVTHHRRWRLDEENQRKRRGEGEGRGEKRSAEGKRERGYHPLSATRSFEPKGYKGYNDEYKQI